jgi:hypothetical protein
MPRWEGTEVAWLLMKLLWISDSPTRATGLVTVGRHLLRRRRAKVIDVKRIEALGCAARGLHGQ